MSATNGRTMSWSDMSESECEGDFAEDSTSVSSFAVPVAANFVPVGVNFVPVSVVMQPGLVGPWAAPQNVVRQGGDAGQPMQAMQPMQPAHVVYGRVEMCASSASSTTSAEDGFGGSNGGGPESKPSRRRLQNKLLYQRDVHYAKGDSSSEASFQSRPSTREPPRAGARVTSGGRQQYQPPSASQRQQSASGAQPARGERRVPKLAAELAPEAKVEACSVPPEVLAQIPYDDEGSVTTVGSIKHATGNCRPCAFLYTNVGCNKGIACAGCHIPHRRKDRPRLGKRERMKDLDFGKEAATAQTGGGQ